MVPAARSLSRLFSLFLSISVSSCTATRRKNEHNRNHDLSLRSFYERGINEADKRVDRDNKVGEQRNKGFEIRAISFAQGLRVRGALDRGETMSFMETLFFGNFSFDKNKLTKAFGDFS